MTFIMNQMVKFQYFRKTLKSITGKALKNLIFEYFIRVKDQVLEDDKTII